MAAADGGAPEPDYRRLGRIAKLGPKEPWQVALLLPEYHDDLTNTAGSVPELAGRSPVPIQLAITSTPQAQFSRGIPRVSFAVTDPAGRQYGAVIFGDTKRQLARLEGIQSAMFLATAKPWGDTWSVQIEGFVEDEWVGRLRPTYPARRQVIDPDEARAVVMRLLKPAIPKACAFIEGHLAPLGPIDRLLTDLGASGWTLEQVIHQAHLPMSAAHGRHAIKVCERLAALGTLALLHAEQGEREGNPIRLSTVQSRMAALPYTPTGDQRRAIEGIAAELAKPDEPARIALIGDVGSGKSTPLAVLCAAVADQPGRRVMVLSPNELLANQLYREIQGYYPDLDIALVTAATAAEANLTAAVLVGTSALLHRDTGGHVDLLVVDEQHRFGVSQREQHVSASTHLIEMSATPIPRTQALIRFGRVKTFELREMPVPKTFITKLREGKQGARATFASVAPALEAGEVVLVVYPKREGEDDGEQDLLGKRTASKKTAGGIDDNHSVQMARARWEAMFPGRVGSLTSDDDADTKNAVVKQFVEGDIQILISTSVVEIGLTLKNLYRMVIVCPERFGLMSLHQLRGRLARLGGEGHCDLLCPEPLNSDQREKLQTFASTTDGFAQAE